MIESLDEDTKDWVFETNGEDEDSFSVLKNSVERLLEEYDALEAESKDGD